ncbi:MAG TPA: hypothetical protein VK607_27485 [Kofleriaceae bacterium]|nr:hypothetical protein [Kofleriaceae bacterium]
MLRVVIASVGLVQLAGCRVSLETDESHRACAINTSSAVCSEAVNHSDLKWIEQNVFAPNCNLGGGGACHGGASDAGKLDLRAGLSHGHLVGVSSMIDRTRQLVVPGDVAASYLMLMLGDVAPAMASPPGAPPPGNIGYMPQTSGTLCCQKLDAIERWIADGAPNN